MDRSGNVADGDPAAGEGFDLPASSDAQVIRAVEWDGRDFVVSWNEGNFGPCTFDPCPSPVYQMKFSRVGSDGDLLTQNASMLGMGVLLSHASKSRRTLFVCGFNGRLWLRLSQPRTRVLQR